MKAYKSRDYHDRALFPIELSDGTLWRLRYPKISDLDLMDDIREAQTARFKAHTAALLSQAEEARSSAEAGGEDGDKAARALIAAQERDPEDITKPYLIAEVLAAFITPEVTPSEVLRRIAGEMDLDTLFEMHEELLAAMTGEAAKKRVRGR